MDDLNVIDRFTETFVTYIDSGFGLLSPDIAFLTTVLIGIDITLAGLFWAFSEDRALLPSLIKKVLYVGAFAFILNNFSNLSTIIFDSFAGLGLQATGSPISAADLMRPGFVAAAGYDAAAPLLEEAGELMGPIAFFENFVTIMVLLFAWVVVLIAFFILAIQLFITILEFKLTTLAGFVLVPFALWNRTAFLAERVLGNVVAAGIKLMVLAVIVGIGSTLFGEFASSFSGGDITLEEAAATVLGALSIFMLGIFGSGIASGLVSGAPQLGAGAVAGSAAGLALGGAAASGAAIGTGRALGAGASGATRAAASMAGGASGSYQIARASSDASGPTGVAAGIAGVARAGAGAVGQGARNMAARATSGVRQAYADGEQGAFAATGGARSGATDIPSTVPSAPDAPDWARRMRREQRMREGVTVAAHTLRDGDRPAAGENPKLKDED
ncbi:P-type conjugative transfer protein TrbL [Chelativorans sp. M5D2P16]|uniref:P-type conjugative transfer protein TrbL n=1 Tax=Chelativorans sp. M5D2P16 TaxID=3095678 RepID=UPI002ACA2AEE|nr:P-type conjugative transfer protein TrbL [Chelativorans sp. M5D2P16]MDZ5696720.1 P-type conjugative transfer protein TrbL [Chelativorans sp. M5D2P16]